MVKPPHALSGVELLISGSEHSCSEADRSEGCWSHPAFLLQCGSQLYRILSRELCLNSEKVLASAILFLPSWKQKC